MVWQLIVQIAITIATGVYQHDRAQSLQLKAKQDATAGEVSLRQSDSGQPLDISYGLAGVISTPVDAVSTSSFPVDDNVSTLYEGAFVQGFRGTSAPADSPLRARGTLTGQVHDFNFDEDKHALMVSREALAANELVELTDVMSSDRSMRRTRLLGENLMVLVGEPGEIPDVANGIGDKERAGGAPWPNTSKPFKFTDTAHAMYFHVNWINAPTFNPTGVPPKINLGKWGKIPTLERVGADPPYTYRLKKEAGGSVSRSWWRPWTPQRLDYILGPALDRGYGEVGHDESSLDLASWYEEQQYDARKMRGADEEDDYLFDDVIDDQGRVQRDTRFPMVWYLIAPQNPAPALPTVFDAAADEIYAISTPDVKWNRIPPAAGSNYWIVVGDIRRPNVFASRRQVVSYQVAGNPDDHVIRRRNIQRAKDGIAQTSPFNGSTGVDILRHMFNGVIKSDWTSARAKEKMLAVKPGAGEYYNRFGKLAIHSPKSHVQVGTEWIAGSVDDFVKGTMTDAGIVKNSVQRLTPNTIDKRNSSTVSFADINYAFAEAHRSYPDKDSAFALALLALDGGKAMTGPPLEADGVVDTYSALTIARTRLFLTRRNKYKWRTTYAYISFHEGDVIRLYNSETRIDGDAVYIVRRREIGMTGVIQWEGFEFNPNDFDWEPTADDDVEDFIKELEPTPPPRNVQAVYDETTGRARVTWLPPINVQIAFYDTQHRVDDGQWENIRTVPGGEPLFVTRDIELGQHVHQFQVSAIGPGKARSAWVLSGELTTIKSGVQDELPLGGGCPPEQYAGDRFRDTTGQWWQFLGDPYNADSRAQGDATSNKVVTRPVTSSSTTETALAGGKSNLTRRINFESGNLIPTGFVEGGGAAYLRLIDIAEETGGVKMELAATADGASGAAGPQLTADALTKLWLGVRMKGYRRGVNFLHTGAAGALTPDRAPRMLLQEGQTFTYAAAGKTLTRAYSAATRPGIIFDRTGRGVPKLRHIVSVGYSRDTGMFSLDLSEIDVPTNDLDGFMANLGPNLESTLVIVFRKGATYLVTHMADSDSTEPYTWAAADKAAADAFFSGTGNLALDYAVMDDHRWRQEFGDAASYETATVFGSGSKIGVFRRNIVGFNFIHRRDPVRGPLHLFGADYLGFSGVYLRGDSDTITAVIETTASSLPNGEPAAGNLFEAGHNAADYRLVILMFGETLTLPISDVTVPGEWRINDAVKAAVLKRWIANGNLSPEASVMVVNATLWDEASIAILSRVLDVHTYNQLAIPLDSLGDATEPYNGTPTEGYMVKYGGDHWAGAETDGLSKWARHIDFYGALVNDYRAVIVNEDDRFATNPLCWSKIGTDPDSPPLTIGDLVHGCPPEDQGGAGRSYLSLGSGGQPNRFFDWEGDPWTATDPVGVEDSQTDVAFTIDNNAFTLAGPGQARDVFLFDVKFFGTADRTRPTKVRFEIWDPNLGDGLTDPDIAIGFRDSRGGIGSQRAASLTRSQIDPAIIVYTYEGDISDPSLQNFIDNLMQVFPDTTFNLKDDRRWRARGVNLVLPEKWSTTPNNPATVGQIQIYANGNIALIIKGGTGDLIPELEKSMRMVLYRERDNATLSTPGPDASVNVLRDQDASYIWTPDVPTQAAVRAFYTAGQAGDVVDVLFYDDGAETPFDLCLALASERCPGNVASGWVLTSEGGVVPDTPTGARTTLIDVVYVVARTLPGPPEPGGRDSQTYLPGGLAGATRIKPTTIPAGNNIYRTERQMTFIVAEGETIFAIASNFGPWTVAPIEADFQASLTIAADVQAGASTPLTVRIAEAVGVPTEVRLSATSGMFAAEELTIAAGQTEIVTSYAAPHTFIGLFVTVQAWVTQSGATRIVSTTLDVLATTLPPIPEAIDFTFDASDMKWKAADYWRPRMLDGPMQWIRGGITPFSDRWSQSFADTFALARQPATLPTDAHTVDHSDALTQKPSEAFSDSVSDDFNDTITYTVG